MTRETKVGLVVAGSFLCLVGGVVAMKLRQLENHDDAGKVAQAAPSAPAPAGPEKKNPTMPGNPAKKNDKPNPVESPVNPPSPLSQEVIQIQAPTTVPIPNAPPAGFNAQPAVQPEQQNPVQTAVPIPPAGLVPAEIAPPPPGGGLPLPPKGEVPLPPAMTSEQQTNQTLLLQKQLSEKTEPSNVPPAPAVVEPSKPQVPAAPALDAKNPSVGAPEVKSGEVPLPPPSLMAQAPAVQQSPIPPAPTNPGVPAPTSTETPPPPSPAVVPPAVNPQTTNPLAPPTKDPPASISPPTPLPPSPGTNPPAPEIKTIVIPKEQVSPAAISPTVPGGDLKPSITAVNPPAHSVNEAPSVPAPIPTAVIPPAKETVIPAPVAVAPPRLGEASPVRVTETKIYTVTAEDKTFQDISRRQYGSPEFGEALMKFNRDFPMATEQMRQNPQVLQPGMKVFLPDRDTLRQGTATPGLQIVPAPSPAGAGTIAPPLSPVSVPPPSAVPGGQSSKSNLRPVASTGGKAEGKLYQVASGGEMMMIIARNQLGDGGRWSDIYRLNPQIDPSRPIPAGTQLLMPVQ
jgi:hypothetical protein